MHIFANCAQKTSSQIYGRFTNYSRRMDKSIVGHSLKVDFTVCRLSVGRANLPNGSIVKASEIDVIKFYVLINIGTI